MRYRIASNTAILASHRYYDNYSLNTTIFCTALVQSDALSMHWNAAIHANRWPVSLYMVSPTASVNKRSARRVMMC